MTKIQRELRLKLSQHFNLQDLETLAFDLGLNWDELAGNTLSSKSQSLIGHLQRNGRLPELIHILQQERPNVIWPELSPSQTTKTLPEVDPVRAMGWNALYEKLWKKKTFLNPFKAQNPLIERFSLRLWADYFYKPIDSRPDEPEEILKEIRDHFFSCDEDLFYDYLTYILNYWNKLNHYKPEIINKAVNKALKKAGTSLKYVPKFEYKHFSTGDIQPIE